MAREQTYLTFSELGYEKPTQILVDELIRSFEKIPTFRLLSMIDNFLSLFPINFDRDKYAYIQNFLSASLFDDDLNNKVSEFFRDRTLFETVIFHREQILLLMKKILFLGSNNGFNPEDSREAKHLLGKVCLMVSDLIVTPEQERKMFSDNPTEDGESDRILTELLTQMLPSTELMNPPDFGTSVARTLDYLHISNTHFQTEFDGKALSAYFEELSGITFERFLQITTGIYGTFITQELDQLRDHPENFNIRKSAHFSNLDFNDEEVEAFYKLNLIPLKGLIDKLEKSPLREVLQEQYDHTVFRKYPLFYLSEDIFTCVDFSFLTEKVSFGLFYTILNILQEKNIDPRTFFAHWGRVFEIYINDIFYQIYPKLSYRFFPNTFYVSKQQIEAFDGLLVYPTSLIVMQYKAGLLNTKAKYSGNAETLLGELNSKYGTASNQSGITQLSRNVERLFNSDSGSRMRIDGLDFSNIRNVYPLLIVNDLSMKLGLVTWRLRTWFEKEIKTAKISNEVSVLPLLVLTVEDLESLSSYLEADDFTFLEFVQFYSKLEYVRYSWFLRYEHWYEPLTTLKDVLTRFREKNGVEYRPNERSHSKFDNFMNSIMSSFKEETQ